MPPLSRLKISAVIGVNLAEGLNETASKTMKLLPHLLCLGVLLGAATGAMAKPAYVTSTVNLRAAPGTTSEIVAKIPGGSRVEADNCTEGWCAVTWQGKSGFAIATALDMSGQVPQRRSARRPPAYADEPGDYVAEGPPVYYEGPAYYDVPPPYYYGPYYRPYGYYRPYYRGYGYRGWRRHW